MPLTKKGKKVMASMAKEYGAKKGKQVFYASANKGVITGVHGSGPFSKADQEKGYKVCYTSNQLRAMDPDKLHMKEGEFMAKRRFPKADQEDE